MNALAVVVDPLYGFVLESTVGACVVVCGVLALQWLFANRLTPRTRYLLWSVLLLRLLLPWAPANPFSAANLISVASTQISANFAAIRPVQNSPVPPAAVPQAQPRDWNTALRLVWLAGCALWGIHVVVTCRRLPRSLGGFREITDARALAAFKACQAETRVTWPPVALTEAEIAYPLVIGLMRPRLVLPKRAVESLSDNELRHIFLHELAHLKRADLIVGMVCSVLQALHWFNPLVWYGFQRMRQDREYACDALALSHMAEEEARNYGRTLIKLVQGGSPPVRLVGAAGIAENKSELERRIRMITQHARSGYRLTATGLVLLAICAAVFLTGATAQQKAVSTSTPPAEFPYLIEIETYQESWSTFRPGDSIDILEVRGTSPKFEVGQWYEVKGRYKLASEKRAMLLLFSTNGEVRPETGGLVEAGEGEFTRQFAIAKAGHLHVSYYPYPGGEGFGDTYFHKKGVPEPPYEELAKTNGIGLNPWQRARKLFLKYFWPF